MWLSIYGYLRLVGHGFVDKLELKNHFVIQLSLLRIENGDDLEKCRLFGVVDPDCYASSTIIKASNIDAAPPRVRKKTKSKFGKKKFQRFPYHVGDETGNTPVKFFKES